MVPSAQPSGNMIFFNCHNGTHMILEDSIIFAEKAGRDKLRCHYDNGVIESSMTLKQLIVQCSNQIIAANRSQVVNIRGIIGLEADLYTYRNYSIRLSNTEQVITLSRHYAHHCISMLKKKNQFV